MLNEINLSNVKSITAGEIKETDSVFFREIRIETEEGRVDLIVFTRDESDCLRIQS